MLQRIQTLYLALSAAIISLLFFMPVAEITVNYTLVYEFYTTKVMQISENAEIIAWNQMSLALQFLIWALGLVTIFLYKKRLLQLRLCVVNIVLLLGLFIMMWMQVNHMTNELEAIKHFRIGFCFPLICIIITGLAIRGIIKDIILIKSYDRIR